MSDLTKTISEIIGEGVHSGLRKLSSLESANSAWWGIAMMPDGEWRLICDSVAEQIISFMKSQEKTKGVLS